MLRSLAGDCGEWIGQAAGELCSRRSGATRLYALPPALPHARTSVAKPGRQRAWEWAQPHPRVIERTVAPMTATLARLAKWPMPDGRQSTYLLPSRRHKHP